MPKKTINKPFFSLPLIIFNLSPFNDPEQKQQTFPGGTWGNPKTFQPKNGRHLSKKRISTFNTCMTAHTMRTTPSNKEKGACSKIRDPKRVTWTPVISISRSYRSRPLHVRQAQAWNQIIQLHLYRGMDHRTQFFDQWIQHSRITTPNQMLHSQQGNPAEPVLIFNQKSKLGCLHTPKSY